MPQYLSSAEVVFGALKVYKVGSAASWKTVHRMIRWLHQRIYQGSAGQGLNKYLFMFLFVQINYAFLLFF